MATDFASSRKRVNRDFTNVVYKEYMQNIWGIEDGTNTVPEWFAYMQKDLLTWYEQQDCSDSLNIIANNQLCYTCAQNPERVYPYVYEDTILPGFPNGYCISNYDPVTHQAISIKEPTGPVAVLVTMPQVGVNPFPSIHCEKPCERRHFNPFPTAVFFEYNSRQPYGTC